MARTKLDLPANFLYETSIKIRISDINYGNHVGHDSLVSVLHEARSCYLKSLNQSELDCFGRGIILTELTVQYKSEVFYGDILTVAFAPQNVNLRSFELLHLVKNQDSGNEVVRALISFLWFDYTTRKVGSIPDKMAEIWNFKP